MSQRELVQRLDEQLGDALHREVHRRAWNAAIVDGLQPTEANSELDLEHRSLLNATYPRYDYTGRWFQITSRGYQLSSSGRILLDRLERGVERHGLWPDDLHIFQLREPLASSERAETELSWSIRLKLTDRERRRLQRALDSRDANDEQMDLESLASIAAEPDGPTPRLARAVGEATSRIRDEAQRMATFELLLSDALATYAIDMRYGNPAWHQPRAWRTTLRFGETGPLRSVHLSGEKKEQPTAAERMQRAIRTARTRTLTAEMFVRVWNERESIDDLIEGVQPPYRQYDRLVRMFHKYRTVVERGGWPEVDPLLRNLGVGSSHPSVQSLKRRLELEGYFPERDAFSPRFTSELKSALTTYQRTHQIWDAGRVTGPTIRSLNVSAEQRWHQLRLALERWRNSRIGADRHYIHVNIPDYHAELWRDGTREMRFRVVVGSSDQPEEHEEDESDEDDGEESEDKQDEEQDEEEDDEPKYPRATPRFSDTLKYVVLNPYWNIPHAIWQEEIKPKKENENADLYDEKGYEVVTDDNGHRFLRQKPGPKNALGKVKFLFPNDHSVYMHDTNEPFLFEQPVRDYSHGCIRIQKPMKLLNYLLDRDGRWTGERRKELLTKWFDQQEERWLKLRESIPVHIEYIVARIGDEGRAHFGADIYDIDQPKLEQIETRMDALPGRHDLPPMDYQLRLEAALNGDFQQPPTL